MNLQFTSRRTGRVREIDLAQPRTALAFAAGALLLTGIVFTAGLQFGRFVAGSLDRVALARELDQQRLDLNAVRGQMQGTVDALAERVGKLNAHLIRLDALGRRVTDLAGLDRGEFNFDDPPPVGGPEGVPFDGGSAMVPELTAALDTLEAQLENRQQQLVVLESLMSSRSLGERIIPGGWPIVGGWISSHFGHRSDPFTGRGAFHSGVDFAAPPGSKVISTGPGLVTYSGYKDGYGYVVEITHPTGYVTRYGHNSRNLVREGRTVQKGEAIAIIGSTGRSTGTHVHFEVERDGNKVNPMRYLQSP
ncbi:MAG: M23 family metallopeptidase [Lysobacterales bacterium]|jgi:murein DD-endopeptidase MepM/ murein hydrolase activator NlpD|nr:MAG: M23 family metallopeptidase [Xanthomonadales bacterium]